MNKRRMLVLLAGLVVVFAATGVGASTPAEPAAKPAAPDLAAEMLPAPFCTEEDQTEAATAAEPAPWTAESAGLETSSWWQGICLRNFCEPCWSDYDCTPGNRCVFDVVCP